MHRVVTISLLTPHSVSVFLMFIRAGLASPHLLIFINFFFCRALCVFPFTSRKTWFTFLCRYLSGAR